MLSVVNIEAGPVAPNLFRDRQCRVPSSYLNQISAAEALTVDLGHFKLCQESWKKTCGKNSIIGLSLVSVTFP